MATLKITAATITTPCGVKAGGTKHDSKASLALWYQLHCVACLECEVYLAEVNHSYAKGG